MSESKTVIRKRLLATRLAMGPEQVAAKSRAAQARILALPAWAEARDVLLYVDFRNEVGTRDLLESAWRAGKRVLLPRCRREAGARGEMNLAVARSAADLCPGAYGIPEPDPGTCPALARCAPDVAVIPAVAYDRHGFRLGYGGGYYDRLLAPPMDSGAGGGASGPGVDMRRTLRIGLAFAFQVCDALPVDPWDMPVHALCTEEALLWLSP
ncbi:MAG: 5-formyltetrahydrofolate cyclo-ligase [Desulfovibrionaceae bacterium]